MTLSKSLGWNNRGRRFRRLLVGEAGLRLEVLLGTGTVSQFHQGFCVWFFCSSEMFSATLERRLMRSLNVWYQYGAPRLSKATEKRIPQRCPWEPLHQCDPTPFPQRPPSPSGESWKPVLSKSVLMTPNSADRPSACFFAAAVTIALKFLTGFLPSSALVTLSCTASRVSVVATSMLDSACFIVGSVSCSLQLLSASLSTLLSTRTRAAWASTVPACAISLSRTALLEETSLKISTMSI